MYATLKSIFLKLLPLKLRRSLEPMVRKVVRIPYSGTTYSCSCCGYSLKRFIEQPTGDLLCPSCSSLERNRFLKVFLEKEYQDVKSVLHFSPAKSLKGWFEKKYETYIPTDYEGVLANNRFDITALPSLDGEIDLVICYHVFEHIPAVRKAMEETYRVLGNGGVMLCQVPFGDAFHEDLSITEPAERLKYFGQEDHVRVYDLDTFTQQLTEVGYQVSHISPTDYYSAEEINRLGLRASENVCLAKKS